MSEKKDSRLLFKKDDGKNGVSTEAYISEKDDFIIFCVEYGETVKKVRGDWDDELYLTVEKRDMPTLLERVSQKAGKRIEDSAELLDWFAESFASRTAFHDIKNFYRDMNIPYRFYNWT
ncbi:MAG: hypothetical protein AAFP70_12090 [Calditrichota bacterium]